MTTFIHWSVSSIWPEWNRVGIIESHPHLFIFVQITSSIYSRIMTFIHWFISFIWPGWIRVGILYEYRDPVRITSRLYIQELWRLYIDSFPLFDLDEIESEYDDSARKYRWETGACFNCKHATFLLLSLLYCQLFPSQIMLTLPKKNLFTSLWPRLGKLSVKLCCLSA